MVTAHSDFLILSFKLEHVFDYKLYNDGCCIGNAPHTTVLNHECPSVKRSQQH